MLNTFRIAWKNLLRYQRRTILTSLLITVGIVAVLLFISISGSFKAMMIGQITDSMLGQMQVHKRGYVSSIDNLPLHLNMPPRMKEKARQALAELDNVEAYSERVKFGAMFSNFTETTNIRLNAVIPEDEARTAPLLADRIIAGKKEGALLSKGKILVPEIIAKGLNVNPGDTVVLVANNKDGSVNGLTFEVQGVLEGISGPGGRDGYMHIDDARNLLRFEEEDVSEIVIRLKNPGQLEKTFARLDKTLSQYLNKQDKPAFEVHTWDKLSPFSNIAGMIDMLTLFIKIMLVSIVLISIMNVMVMAVYERIREIGTISAIGTRPGRILSLFVTEGLLLGLVGTASGTIISLIIIAVLNVTQLTFSFARQDNLVLAPDISAPEVLTICAVVIVVAILASVQPAWKASRMDPIMALRHV
ncbi:MAG: FtsX-like permease family protein [Gammaproteobacteria bacterium]|nr:FtsX-like permease family protein [Gammaproteobacteria bacterium]